MFFLVSARMSTRLARRIRRCDLARLGISGVGLSYHFLGRLRGRLRWDSGSCPAGLFLKPRRDRAHVVEQLPALLPGGRDVSVEFA